MRVLCCVLLGLALPLSAQANAYKCRLPGGKVEISSTPCPDGSKTVSSQTSDTVSPEQREAAEQRLKQEREFLKDREAARAAEAARQPPPPPPPPPPPEPPPAPPPTVVPGNTVIVTDPVSTCVSGVNAQRLTPQQRESQLIACNNLGRPTRSRPAHSGGTPQKQPGLSIEFGKCVGKNCP